MLLSICSNPKANICHIMFKEKVTCAFKGMRRVKHCNFLITKLEERCLLRNTQLFQGLDNVGTQVTHSGNNYQSCTVAGIKNLHQEINKHLTLSDTANQIESYWLLPPLTYATQHEDLGMICYIACSTVTSKVLKACNTVNLLIDISSNMRQNMRSLSDIVCKFSFSILNTWA